jgi:hypothetical protein
LFHFNDHSRLAGTHALLSASNYHWINYDEEKMARVFYEKMTAVMGTRLHAFAKEAILLGVKMADVRKTLNMYINDCIGYRMEPEKTLFVTVNCYGTVDAIKFDEVDMFLRIFDLKNGKEPASMNQLKVYAAMFCMEYGYPPNKIRTELRIYQNDDIAVLEPETHDIFFIIDRIRHHDRLINELREEAS